jgi:hypothetical protein
MSSSINRAETDPFRLASRLSPARMSSERYHFLERCPGRRRMSLPSFFRFQAESVICERV